MTLQASPLGLPDFHCSLSRYLREHLEVQIQHFPFDFKKVFLSDGPILCVFFFNMPRET